MHENMQETPEPPGLRTKAAHLVARAACRSKDLDETWSITGASATRFRAWGLAIAYSLRCRSFLKKLNHVYVQDPIR